MTTEQKPTAVHLFLTTLIAVGLVTCIAANYYTLREWPAIIAIVAFLASTITMYWEHKIDTDSRFAIAIAIITGLSVCIGAICIGFEICSIILSTDTIRNISRGMLIVSLGFLIVPTFNQFAHAFGEVYSKHA